MSRHAHITQNNKLAISLQDLKKEVSDAVGFLHADEHESLLQIDTMILMEMVKCSQSSGNSKFCSAFTISQKKKFKMKLTFSMQININVSYKLISTPWASKISTR